MHLFLLKTEFTGKPKCASVLAGYISRVRGDTNYTDVLLWCTVLEIRNHPSSKLIDKGEKEK